MRDRYWLGEWLDYNDLNSVEAVEKSLASPTVIADLRQASRNALRKQNRGGLENNAAIPHSIVAGRGIDLTGQLSCRSDVCRRRQVDELFTRVWHYFDQIIVHDDLAGSLDREWSMGHVKDQLLSNIKVLLYLRQIGASDLVEFRPKPKACTVHFDQHAREAGLTEIKLRVDQLVQQLMPKVHVHFFVKNGQSTFRLSHPLLEVSHGGSMEHENVADIDGSPELKATTLVARRIIAHLSSDIAASHRYHAPLGTVLKTHELLLNQFHSTSVTDVVLNLNLPVLDGLQPWDLIAIRRDEQEYFNRFRDSLTKTIKERLKVDPDSGPLKLADELREDLIEPRLRDLSARLSAAQRLMTKKSSVGLFLGAVSTTCGILSGLDPHLACMGGTGVAIACAGTATAKFLDESRDVQMDDMYFLWKGAECVPH